MYIYTYIYIYVYVYIYLDYENFFTFKLNTLASSADIDRADFACPWEQTSSATLSTPANDAADGGGGGN